MNKSNIVVAGSTGALGSKIVKALLDRKANVKALVRRESSTSKTCKLQAPGLEIIEVDFNNNSELEKACLDASCVISALAGLQEVIIDAQKNLLNAAVNSGVNRFIPSDFSLDFTKTLPGNNRNLDMRRDFHYYLDKTPISPTSIYNGAFTNLLTGQAPIILFKIKRIMYWGDPDQKMDFTTMDNTAEFTAGAALDSSTPRSLHISGDAISPRELSEILSKTTGSKFKILRAGNLRLLNTIIKVTKTLNPSTQQLYPAWQGMQYLSDMASGLARANLLDNDRYPGIKWQNVSKFLTEFLSIQKVTL